MRNFLCVAIAAVTLGACATPVMTQKECLAGDWYGAGLEDGGNGLLAAAFDDRAAACAEFESGADGRAYFEGREAGLRRLCNEAGGYEYGFTGNDYRGVCAVNAEGSFLSGYLSGRRVFGAEEIRNLAQKNYDEAENSIDAQRRSLDRELAALDDPEITPEEAEKARESADYYRQELRRARRQSDDMLYELGRADENLDQTIAGLADWRRGPDFQERLRVRREVFAFARTHPDIDHCTDEVGAGYPVCHIAIGAAVRETGSEAICIDGPALAVLYRVRAPYEAGGLASGAYHLYDLFPIDERGRPAKLPTRGMEVYFDAPDEVGGGPALSRIACAAPSG
ncbi:MAG: DUF2799 domain-containing protein [Marinicaulis sp.]|nr:DUF2799 domain-containing protein [Marinicaulis sp.]